ncbi:MAG: hypothetical protein HY255_08720 [Betaproteobacteria bacterium]|nr:hypothetical protein [Betaproteobacteria bacterium]
MFERFSRSWGLVKASAAVLAQDKELLVFPLISGVAALLVLACFALPLFGLGALDGLSGHKDGVISAGYYFVAFLFYVTQYFVIFFFNAALVGAAMQKMNGEETSVGAGIDLAWSRASAIFGYAVIAATVGLILRAIEERVGILGRIVAGLIGLGWTLATYLAVPVLVGQDIGPWQAVKESAGLLKRTWGENVIGQAGLGAAFMLINLVLLLCIGVLVVFAVITQSVIIIASVAIVGVAILILSALVHSALSGIYAAALYRFATRQPVGGGFDVAVLQSAFVPKK